MNSISNSNLSNSNLSNKKNIAFSARIRPASLSEYTKEISEIYMKPSSYVKYPWTAKEIIKAPKAYTDGIMDCTAGGITDGHDVVMFHLCPSFAVNKDFDNIREVIKSKLDLSSSKLSGFLLGSDKKFPDSRQLFEKLKKFMSDLKIPTTCIGGNKGESTNLVYNSKKDEWIISNFRINQGLHVGTTNPEELLKSSYEDVFIAPQDKLSL
jgi:hypothetical protein